MNKVLTTCISVILFMVILCPVKARSDRLTIVASVFPLFDFAREIAGPAADVSLLLPPGVDPHSWEPKPSDMVLLSAADVFIFIGGGMEPWAETFERSFRVKGIVTVGIMDRLDLPEHNEDEGRADNLEGEHHHGEDHEGEHHHGEDPHFWLDLSLAAEAVEMIGRVMAESDQGNRDLYTSNAGSYSVELRNLDRAYSKGLEVCASRQIVTGGHAAFGHLARRYDLEQVSVYGLSPDSEPSPRHLAEVIKTVREGNVRTVFSEELINPKMTQVLSQETGTKILILNPAGNLAAEQWKKGVKLTDIVKDNLMILREGLECE